MKISKNISVLAAAWIAAGCASTPNLPTYKAQLAADFANASATQAEPVAEFWRAFGDADLDALVAQAIKANADLRIAGANLREARALANFADAQSKPTIGASADAARVRARDSQGKSQTGNVFAAGFDVAWEADLFGRISGERQAALAQVLASESLVRAAQVSVASEVARNYFELRGFQEQLRVAKASLETQRAALKLVAARLAVGRGTALDTERANALVQTTAASIPSLETALIRTRYRIAVLSGQVPTALDTQLANQKPLPGMKPVALNSIGSPPVSTTCRASHSSHSARISSTVRSCPSGFHDVYGVSQNQQRRLHPLARMKTLGTPVRSPSPWIDL